MKLLQTKYKELLHKILRLLWREWSALGVAGEKNDMKPLHHVIDPESLLLFSFSLCRFDPRLFDEIIDWLNINGEFINIQRLINIQTKYIFESGPQISAVAEILSQKKEHRLKWKKLASLYKNIDERKLFITPAGKEIPVKNPDPFFLEKGVVRNRIQLRGNSVKFPLTGVESMLLRMRALFGINSRAEIITILGSVPEIYPAELSRLTGYERRSVQSVLIELSRSGILDIRSDEKEKYYRLSSGTMKGFLPPSYKWINFTPLYKGLEILVSGIRNSPGTNDLLILSSDLRRYSKEAAGFLNSSSSDIFLSDSSRHPGEKYVEVFIDDIERIISFLDNI
jgi:DNA-binding transcriptional ArsR family regulator